jgi:hypothetical protein
METRIVLLCGNAALLSTTLPLNGDGNANNLTSFKKILIQILSLVFLVLLVFQFAKCIRLMVKRYYYPC